MRTHALLNSRAGPLPDQRHLDYSQRVNLGGYYTHSEYVSMAWSFIRPLLAGRCAVLDTSCGYGNFLIDIPEARIIGSDIDAAACEVARRTKPFADIYCHNALTTFSRKAFGVSNDETLFIIGNPPYNDTTSIIRNGTKKLLFDVDPGIQSRDLGISFLLSYRRLQADYVCVLHPLSYLIKKTNFLAMKQFVDSYRLINAMIISSGVFSETSKFMQFPIVIALYKKHLFGMDYGYIRSYRFSTVENKSFSMDRLDFIGNYIDKYPSKDHLKPATGALMFYTMRDLNALKRSRTFLDKYESNAIVIRPDKLDYYVYVDVVKDFRSVFPYYFGNFDVLIDNNLFLSYRNYFISNALRRRPFLRQYYHGFNAVENNDQKILEYFKLLLGEHYVESRNN